MVASKAAQAAMARALQWPAMAECDPAVHDRVCALLQREQMVRVRG